MVTPLKRLCKYAAKHSHGSFYRRLPKRHAIPDRKHNVPREDSSFHCGSLGTNVLSGDTEKMRMNPRVEVFLLEETVEQLLGTPEERNDRVL